MKKENICVSTYNIHLQNVPKTKSATIDKSHEASDMLLQQKMVLYPQQISSILGQYLQILPSISIFEIQWMGQRNPAPPIWDG